MELGGTEEGEGEGEWSSVEEGGSILSTENTWPLSEHDTCVY